MRCLQCNKELVGQQKMYCSKQCSKLVRMKRWRDSHKEYVSLMKKEWDLKNKEHKSNYRKNFYQENIKRAKELKKQSVLSGRTKELYYINMKDLNFRIKQSLRARLYVTIKKGYKSVHTIDLIGCTIEELKAHLETQFAQGMNFSNYGQWHIDHKVPCANFDLTKLDNQRKCFHFSNLQPLWAVDNLKKGTYVPKGE